MLYDIILKSKTSFLDRLFTYKYDNFLEIGTRVIVPFGKANSKNLGIIVRQNKNEPDYEIKKIVEVLDTKPIVSKELIDLAFYMIKYNISDYSSAVNTILPPGSIDKVEEFYIRKNKLEEYDKNLYDYLIDYKSFEQINKHFKNNYTKSYINELVKKNYLDSYISTSKKSSAKYRELINLKDVKYIDKLRKNAFKQLEVLNYLKENGTQEKQSLINKTNSNTQIINSLEEKGLIENKKSRIYRNVLDNVKYYKKLELNKEQKDIFDKVISSKNNSFLLHGVTGSGKTELYLHLVEYYVNLGKEAIILVPEISLTPQTIERFQGRFGKNIAVLHSKLNISERADQWSMIKNKEVKIVVGARSAIFAPFENLGIIVIDEAHESSYISEKNPKYSAIDIAQIRSNINNAKLILGTATPSIKSYYDFKNNEFELLEIKNRANYNKLPEVQIVDMRDELKKNNFSMFSSNLKLLIDEALTKKEQIILFLNKRGHSSFVFCRHCGYVHKCDACDVAMTYHKSKERMICHYCGRTAKKMKKCINCGSTWIKEFGAGTEMLEEETKKIFPDAKVFRMDADTVSKKSDFDIVYQKMRKKEIDILIGTQMLAKGFDFPDVSVVGIVSADVSLNLPDFRAKEKTFNLLTQVSGRAGRSNKQGNVVIQTYSPDSYAIVTAAKNDYKSFYNYEMNERVLFNYPPYIKILNINISSKDRFYAIKRGRVITQIINDFIRKDNLDIVEMTGPISSLIEKVNNRYRFDIIVKSHSKNDLIKISEQLRSFKDNQLYINFKLEEE